MIAHLVKFVRVFISQHSSRLLVIDTKNGDIFGLVEMFMTLGCLSEEYLTLPDLMKFF